MRSEKAHLRTRVGEGGMDYKGYNIAIHELGHNVEQTISLNDIDYTLLAGVPNTAFTEALAFVFQGRDLELLGLANSSVFNKKDVILLGIYSHMIHSFLYLPDYPIGHLIAQQIEEQMNKTGTIGSEVERMAKIGNVAPDLWMKIATNSSVGPEALLAATERALEELAGDIK